MYIKINQQNIYFQKIGKGKDLIMLHGWGLDVSTFWPVADLLKNHFTVWLLDLPGHGRSDLPKRAFGVADFARLVEDFIKINNIKKPVLLGHSFGGRVIIKMASSKHAKILDKIILEDSAGISQRNKLKNTFFLILAKLAKYGLPNFFNFKNFIRVKIYKSLESDYKDIGYLKETFKLSITEDLTEGLKKINLPALILWGEKDRSTPLRDGLKMYQLIKNSRLVVLEGVGHAPHIKTPELFTCYIKDFGNN